MPGELLSLLRESNEPARQPGAACNTATQAVTTTIQPRITPPYFLKRPFGSVNFLGMGALNPQPLHSSCQYATLLPRSAADRRQRLEHDLHVEPERPVVDVEQIIAQLHLGF